MAIIYGKDTAKDYAAGNLASFGKSYSRMGAAPLDMYEVWYDKAELVKYASFRGNDANGNPVYDLETEVTDTSAVTSYVGQKVAYVDEENNKIYHYSIGLEGQLEEIGITPVGDGKVVTVDNNGKISLVGIENAEALQIPRIAEDGETLEWVDVTDIVYGDGKSVEVGENGQVQLKGFDALTKDKVGFVPRLVKIVDRPAEGTVETRTLTGSTTCPRLGTGRFSIAADGPITNVEIVASYGGDKPAVLTRDTYDFTFDENGACTFAVKSGTDIPAGIVAIEISYTATYTVLTGETPEEYHLEIEWAKISTSAEGGDGNTLVKVVGTNGVEVTEDYSAEVDTYLYTVDIEDRLDTFREESDGLYDAKDAAKDAVSALEDKLINGVDEAGEDFVVFSAEHAEKATKDAAGNVISEHYATKTLLGEFDTNLRDALQGNNGLDVLVVAEADKAVNDGSGNDIEQTYATKVALKELSDDYGQFNQAVIEGTFNGEAFYVAQATKALQDGDGNVIKSTYAKTADLVDYTVTMEENTEDASVAKTYIFKQLNKEIGRINLAKELVVTSGTVKEVVTENVPYQGAQVGEKYIELLIANQEQPLYIPANDLVEYITTEDTTTIDLTLDTDHKLTAELKDNAVGTAKIADKAVTVAKLEEAVQTKLGYVDVNKNVTVAIADAVKGLAGGEGVTATVKGNAEAIENITKTGGAIDTKIGALELGTMSKEAAADYVKKADAVGYNDILTKTAAEGIYAKAADLGDLAGVDKITNAHIADNAAIAVSKIDGLGALATKGEIKNADVADDAAIAVAKIAGLADAATTTVATIQAGVIGTTQDAETANTVYGAKKYAEKLDTATNEKYDAIVEQIGEFHDDVTEALNTKVDAGTIAHTADGVAEGVTRNGTTLNIVVDSYTKTETYTKTEINKLLADVEGGSTESAASVSRDLLAYKKALDAEVYGDKPAWTGEDGSYNPVYTETSRIDTNAQNIDLNTAAINAIKLTLNGEGETRGLTGRVSAIETRLDTTITTDINGLKETTASHTGTLTAHSTAINKINTETVPALQQSIKDLGDADKATNDKIGTVATGNTVVGMINDVDKKFENYDTAAQVDAKLANYAKSADVYTKTQADAEFMTQDEVDARIDALIVAADPDTAGGKTIENIQSLVKYVDENAADLAGLTTQVGKNTAKLSDIAEGQTVKAAVLAAIPGATASALGLVKYDDVTIKKNADGQIYVATATKDALGAVKYDDASIKKNANDQLYVAEVSTDNLVQGTKILVLNGGNAGVTAN